MNFQVKNQKSKPPKKILNYHFKESSCFSNPKKAVEKHLDYYPFGFQLPTRSINSNSYRYGFQGQLVDNELKGNGNSVNFKYRMHDPRLGRFFAVDPLTREYPHNSPYAFSENRLIDAIELEGLEMFLINGTWGFNGSWDHDPELKNNLKEIFGNKEVHVRVHDVPRPSGEEQGWSGGNSREAREEAADQFIDFIKKNLGNGEPITIVGHSHGGNVGKLIMNRLVEDDELKDRELNLVTLNSPGRKDYVLSEKAQKRVNYYHVHNEKFDFAQRFGGFWIKMGDGAQKGGELGYARPTHSEAINISYRSDPSGEGFETEVYNRHRSWYKSNVSKWIGKLNQAVKTNMSNKGGSGKSPTIYSNSRTLNKIELKKGK